MGAVGGGLGLGVGAVVRWARNVAASHGGSRRFAEVFAATQPAQRVRPAVRAVGAAPARGGEQHAIRTLNLQFDQQPFLDAQNL